MEKKLRPYQKLALERIYRLFELAENAGEEKRRKRYIGLAQSIGKKTNVSIPKSLKQKYCRNCLGADVEKKEEGSFVVVKCRECGEERKYAPEKKKKAEN